ncbi:hypothetical protein J6590_015214 [Homalodisca vitripennis]|nr:hypothetical protein J6590_015214 [Homalodisca vitripennis]
MAEKPMMGLPHPVRKSILGTSEERKVTFKLGTCNKDYNNAKAFTINKSNRLKGYESNGGEVITVILCAKNSTNAFGGIATCYDYSKHCVKQINIQ